MARSFRNLQVWRRTMDWAPAIYRVSAEWPSEEKFGLVSQVRRAAVSVAANIAEGSGRHTDGEFRQFLGIARGSLAEVETLLLLSLRLELAQPGRIEPLLEEADEIGKMISGLSRTLR